jgi:hypothetical protein
MDYRIQLAMMLDELGERRRARGDRTRDGGARAWVGGEQSCREATSAATGIDRGAPDGG